MSMGVTQAVFGGLQVGGNLINRQWQKEGYSIDGVFFASEKEALEAIKLKVNAGEFPEVVINNPTDPNSENRMTKWLEDNTDGLEVTDKKGKKEGEKDLMLDLQKH